MTDSTEQSQTSDIRELYRQKRWLQIAAHNMAITRLKKENFEVTLAEIAEKIIEVEPRAAYMTVTVQDVWGCTELLLGDILDADEKVLDDSELMYYVREEVLFYYEETDFLSYSGIRIDLREKAAWTP